MTRPDGSLDRSIEQSLATGVEGPGLDGGPHTGSRGHPRARCAVRRRLISGFTRRPGNSGPEQLISAGVEVGEQYLADNPDADGGGEVENGASTPDGTRSLEILFSLVITVQTTILMSMHWRVLQSNRCKSSPPPISHLSCTAGRTTGRRDHR